MTANKHWSFLFFKGILPNLIYFVPIIVIYYLDAISFEFFMVAILLIVLTFFLILFYVHYQYYINDKNIILEDTIIKKGGKVYYLKDIKEVVINKPKYFDNEGGRLGYRYISFDNYFYFEIIFNSNERLKITCLIDKDFEEKLKPYTEIKFTRKNSTFSNFPDW